MAHFEHSFLMKFHMVAFIHFERSLSTQGGDGREERRREYKKREEGKEKNTDCAILILLSSDRNHSFPSE